MSKLTFLFVCILLFHSCNQVDRLKGTGPFMGMSPTESPKLLFPELIASPVDEYNGTFNPEGDLFFYTTNPPGKGIITYTEMNEDGTWSAPKPAPFSVNYSEYDPLFTPDGTTIFFSSTRPATGGSEGGVTNIWFAQQSANGWYDAQEVSFNEGGMYYSSITRDGKIYFNMWDNGSLFKAQSDSSGYTVTRLDSILQLNFGVGDPFISPDEDYLIFRGYENSLGQGDLYISFNIEGNWTQPENLGEPINSSSHEMCPYVTVDGKYFIFASARIEEEFEVPDDNNLNEVYRKFNSHDNGELNIYYMSADFISEMREKYMVQ